MRRPIPLLVSMTVLAAAVAGQQANWPSFRGAQARGLASGTPPPVTWDLESGENVAWRTPVPGLAHSSPVVWGDRVFVTTAVRTDADSELSSLYGSPGYGAGESVADEGEHAFAVLCLDLHSGAVRWERTAHRGVPKIKRHPKSSHASCTPACDAGHVVACFGSEGLYCYDHDGELLWQRDLGVLNTGAPGHDDRDGFQWGVASSPVIAGDRVVVQCDHEGESFVAAFALDGGDELWRTPRDEDSTWCTPTFHEVAAGGRAQVILNGYRHIGGYDVATGASIWRMVGGGDVPVPAPVVAGDLVFLTSAHGRSRPIRAIRTTAEGLLGDDPDVDPSVAWVLPNRGIYMQTPLVNDGLLYCCADGGILSCYEAATGAQVYRQRLGSGTTGFSASAVAAGGRLYLTAENGEVHVVREGREFEQLAVNELGETCMATPAIVDGTLLFRTRHQVVAIRAAGEE